METESLPPQKRILLVDDEPTQLRAVNEYLKRVGYEVTPVKDGHSALDAVIDEPPDLVISDILLEGMDGIELHRRVSALTGDSIPFIFLATQADPRERIAGLQSGADDCIVMPFEPEELQARVSAVLRRIEQTRLEERQDTERQHRRLLNEVSRRLRPPLRRMMAQLSVLMSERLGSDEARQRRYLARAMEEANTLRSLIDDLSWASPDIEEELSLRTEPLRVAPIVRSASANAARLAAERGVELRVLCGGLLSANMDGPAMTRALAGLLEAAVSISAEGSQVQISARRADEGGLEFTVADGGCVQSGGQPAPRAEVPTNVMDMARRVVQAHGGRFTSTLQDGRHSMVIWLPGRVVRHVGHS
ncbi:MAG: response regulator [Chloroflexi bacterium]|nr:response regulator [Chloroflexota bacterium]